MKKGAGPILAAFLLRAMVLLAIATVFFLSAVIHADGGQGPVLLDCTPEAFPALRIQGDDVSRYPSGQPSAFRGFADPCIRRDPLSGRLWLAYSWPHIEHVGEGRSDFVVGVETHLASSTDGGRTWKFVQVLWPRTPARYTDLKTGAKRDGFISHEVPNILPCKIDGEPAWVGARLDYFLPRKGNYRARDNRSFCLRVLTAPTPLKLATAPYVTFGDSWNTPQCGVDFKCPSFSSDFPPFFIPNEPALFFSEGRLYLSFVCMTFRAANEPDFARSFIAVFSTVPKGPIGKWKWRYHGKLAGHREARELGGEALTQIELAMSRHGGLLALLTPESWDPIAAGRSGGDAFYGIRHHGCAVVEVDSLDAPALARRKDGKLALRAFLFSSSNARHGPGAAAYDPASATGVLFTLRDLSHRGRQPNLSWSIHPTGLHP